MYIYPENLKAKPKMCIRDSYNSMNGWPAGTPIPNTEFEIYNARTGKLVDTIRDVYKRQGLYRHRRLRRHREPYQPE